MGKDDARIVDYVVTGIFHGRPGHQLPQFPRVGYDAENSGCSGRFRGAEVDLVILGAAPAGEIPRESPEGNLIGAWRLPHADTAEAAGLVDLGPCQKEHHD